MRPGAGTRRDLVFTNPTTGLRSGMPETRVPLPIDVKQVLRALEPDDLARAAVVALVAFHAPRARQVRHLHLTDLRDHRLHIDGRMVLLAAEVRNRLTAWLDYRRHRWPNTINPHLFINQYTASRTGPVSTFWLGQLAGLSLQALREDRILDEATATTGDARRVCDLFGLTVNAAVRYTGTVDVPGGVVEAALRTRRPPPIP